MSVQPIIVHIPVGADALANVLCHALHGALSHWIADLTVMRPSVGDEDLAPLYDDGAWVIYARGVEGGSSGPHYLTRATLRAGLEKMREEHPAKFARIMANHSFTHDADILVQFSFFGEVLFE